jgi:DNA-binding MarR family transcriptional regulator
VNSASPATLDAIERAMVRLRRSIGRRELGKAMARRLGLPGDLSPFFAIDAVDEASSGAGQGVTVGVVAERLGVDPSRASRLVASAVRAGYLARVASQADGRLILLELTESGRAMVRAMRSHRQAYFDRLMRGWSDRDREEFARLLTRFARALDEVEGPRSGGG